MAADEQSPVRVDVGVSAKAEIKTEIPSESSGRALDALVDVFRPFTEARGLRADQIRLQREDVLLEIARRAKKRLEVSGELPKSVPNKFLIPFLERASLEDISHDALMDAWANLLSSASVQFDERMIRYTAVLAEMGPSQARFLDRLAKNNMAADKVRDSWSDAPLRVSDLEIALHFREYFSVSDAGEYLDELYTRFDLPGSILISAGLFDDGDSWTETRVPEGFPSEWGYSELEVLDSLSVVKHTAVSTFTHENWTMFVEYVVLTSFGASFYNACTGIDQILEREIRAELSAVEATQKSKSDSAGE